MSGNVLSPFNGSVYRLIKYSEKKDKQISRCTSAKSLSPLDESLFIS